MRLGIFGGSFDPPHVGHLLAAIDAAEHLSLDTLFWVPAFQQPLKAVRHHATAEQRYALVAAAATAHPLFQASRIEIDRDGLSYTVTTLEALSREHPGAECFLLVGEDAWGRFPEWHEPERITTLARTVVLTRPPETPRSTGPQPDHWLRTRRIEISSTEIRARVRSGKPIRGFVQDGVAEIIESERLYRW